MKNNKFSFGSRIFFSKKKSLGEVNVEFVVFSGIMIFILAVASFAALAASQGVSDDNEVADARRIAYITASEINLAVETGTGYKHSFQLPNYLYNSVNYTVNFTEARFISILWNGKAYSLPVLAKDISGNVTTGHNVISNIDGVIYFD